MPRIPNVLHYCFNLAPDFGDKPWSLVHYACLKSAVERLQPDEVFFYYEYEPQGAWWEITKPLVTSVQVIAPREIFGRPLLHPAHRADVIRLERLIEQGGIYLDADVLVHRSFSDLMDNSTVLGREGMGQQFGTANSVILAEPGAPFLRRWYEEYRSFRGRGPGQGEFWNEHSVELPAKLAAEHPAEITVLPPTAFFWPLWTPGHIEWIFNSADPIPIDNAYASHLWESRAWHYLDGLAPGDVRARDTNFHRWARPYVAELPSNFGLPFPRTVRRTLGRIKRRIGSALRGSEDASRGRSGRTGEASRRKTFEEIYRNKLWGGEDDPSPFFSGVGSRGAAADDYVKNMVPLLRQHEDELGHPLTIVDIGCGDFEVGRALVEALPSLTYIGCDIVSALIEHHRAKYQSERVSFELLDVTADRPPHGNVCLVRQVFQHLSNADIADALRRLDEFDILYVTESQPEYRAGSPNPDHTTGSDVRFDWRRGYGRGVELSEPPFGVQTQEMFRASAPLGSLSHEIIVTERVCVGAATSGGNQG